MDEMLLGVILGAFFSGLIVFLITWEVTGREWEKEAIELGYGEMVLKDKFSEYSTFEWKKLDE